MSSTVITIPEDTAVVNFGSLVLTLHRDTAASHTVLIEGSTKTSDDIQVTVTTAEGDIARLDL